MRINKAAGVILLLTAVFTVSVFTANAGGGYIYKSKVGKNLTEQDFVWDFSEVRSSVSSGGKAKFCFEPPKIYFNGYAVYATKGDFQKSLSEETPLFVSKKGKCWTYPGKVSVGDKVSVKIYPYVILEDGAKKYIQPGFSSSLVVKPADIAKTIKRPIIVSPEKNQVFTNFPRLATLEWREMAGAEKYEVKIYCDTCNDSKHKWQELATYETAENTFITPALPGDNGYRFKVRAKYENERYSSWSGVRHFRFDTKKYTEAKNNVSLSISGWNNGLPVIDWETDEKDVAGYAIYVKEGVFDKDEITKQVPFFAGKEEDQRQLVKLKKNTLYTVKVVPYKKAANGYAYYAGEGSNTLYFTTGNY